MRAISTTSQGHQPCACGQQSMMIAISRSRFRNANSSGLELKNAAMVKRRERAEKSANGKMCNFFCATVARRYSRWKLHSSAAPIKS
jgi:hypothetical protein